MEQLEMFGSTGYYSEETRTRGTRWYYIENLKKTEMVVLLENGFAWAEYDLQYSMPHLFNSIKEAKRVSGGLNGQVRIYPFNPDVAARWQDKMRRKYNGK